MKAIETQYHGATNTRGSRISADDGDRSKISIPIPMHLSGVDAHAAAAIALAKKMGWNGTLISGSTKKGYVFVFADDKKYTIK